MKDGVKSLIKSPTAFMIGMLLLVLALLFVIRIITGSEIVSTQQSEPTQVTVEASAIP